MGLYYFTLKKIFSKTPPYVKMCRHDVFVLVHVGDCSHIISKSFRIIKAPHNIVHCFGYTENITAFFYCQRWAVPSTKVPRYFFSTGTDTDGTFSKIVPMYRYRCTFLKTNRYFQFFIITYRLKFFSFWSAANKFLIPKYSVTVRFFTRGVGSTDASDESSNMKSEYSDKLSF